MATMTESKSKSSTMQNDQAGEFFGKLYAFSNTLKLYHWHVTGRGSYAEHMALDQAIEQLSDPLDRIVETSYSLYGDINIVIPECRVPSDISGYCTEFYEYVDQMREEILQEDFSQSIIDDIAEAIQQLLYRLKRLQ